MLEEDNNNINLYSDYEHEAESMVRSSIKEEEKNNLSQSKINAKSRDEKIAELKKKDRRSIEINCKK